MDGNDAGDFTITANSDGDGVLTFQASPDYEDPKGSPGMDETEPDNTYEITVQVRDSKDDSGTADTAVDDTLEVVVTVTDVNEHADLTTTLDAYDFVENATTAVATFEATDPDSGFVLTWTLTGADAEDFEIMKDTEDADQDGVLTFKNPPNYEDPNGYSSHRW